MAEEQRAPAHVRVITVSREYGSGGGEVARRLAERLNWALIDHEVLVRVAQQLGVSEAEAAAYDERVESLATRILNNLRLALPISPVLDDPNEPMSPQAFHDARRQVIDSAVSTGHVVIVGRGAQAYLAEQRDAFHVRIVAPMEARIAYVMQREGRDRAGAHSRVVHKDEERARYLQTFYRRLPSDAHLYDIVLNTGGLDLEGVVDVIEVALERKNRRLARPASELDHTASLAPYPSQPEARRPTAGV